LGFIGESYLKITLEPIRTQNLGSLLMKLSQSNFNWRSPDSDSVRSYLIATVSIKRLTTPWNSFLPRNFKDLWCRSLTERIYLKLIFLKKEKTLFIGILFQKVILWQPHCILFIPYKRDHVCFYFSIYFLNIFFLKVKDYLRQVKPSFPKKLIFENGLHAKSANDTNERAKEVCLHGISRFSMKSNFKTWFLGKICL